MLPTKSFKLPPLILPTAWQTVIFRNYGYVQTQRIAATLGCDNQTIEREAKRLGLQDNGYSSQFESRGYITIIRNNWYLLPYSQLLTLLGFDEERLTFALEKDDFLGVKLGNFKPECAPVFYQPLTQEQLQKTQEIAQIISAYEVGDSVRPFDFFHGEKRWGGGGEMLQTKDGKRIVHGYLSPCGDVFASDCTDTLPDELLQKYQQIGVNGIWLHGLLSALSPYPFAPALSAGYQTRRENLNKLIKRCQKYGILVYLYFNEPRALPPNSDPVFEHLIGDKQTRTLCMEKEEVRKYLYQAVKDLCEHAKDLGGIFTITMSENPTHCNYGKQTSCPICRRIPPQVSAATVNNVIYRAVKDSGCKGEVIANLWGWSPFMGWTEEQTFEGISLLDKGISVMCVSEYDLEIEKGGVKSRVIDYSISNPGPSEITKRSFEQAKNAGHTLFAKIQASNSWECSAVPYLPVFDLVAEHIKNLSVVGVNDYFLTWTLGGYPSYCMQLAAEYQNGTTLEKWYEKTFGKYAQQIHGGVQLLCEGFKEYPFSIDALYYSPKNLGPANVWDLQAQDNLSAMVCYSFDDIETWINPYPYQTYVEQLEKLLKKWEAGIAALNPLPLDEHLQELVRYATVAYCHFKTDLLQTQFAYYKRQQDKEQMRRCVLQERENAQTLLQAVKQDAKVGFEASNHYVYTKRNLIEKILQMDDFAKRLE